LDDIAHLDFYLYLIYINDPMINKYAQFFAGLMNLEDAVTLAEN